MIGNVGDTGILETGSEPPCPVCGVWGALGYYGDWSQEDTILICENCGSEIEIERVTEYHYTVRRVPA